MNKGQINYTTEEINQLLETIKQIKEGNVDFVGGDSSTIFEEDSE
jgi:hypothetical protein